MRKFTESMDEEEKSGHRDHTGKWIDEPNVEKVRNRLTSFWTLSTMLADKDMRQRFLTDPSIQKLFFQVADTCEENKPKIQNLLGELSKIETLNRQLNDPLRDKG